jgi:hypothetical protein
MKLSRRRAIQTLGAAGFAPASLASPQSANAREKAIKVKRISGDATPEVLAIFLSARPGQALNVTFEKGTYHFYPDKGLEFYRHISNHDDVVTRCAFPLRGLENVSVNGNGSKFIFHGLMIPFIVDDCKNVTLENFSINWEMPLHSEGLVVANNEAAHTYDLEFSDDTPYEIRNRTLWFKKEYREHEMGQSYFFDPKIWGVAHNTLDYSPWGSNAFRKPVAVKHGKEIDYPYPYSYDRDSKHFTDAQKEMSYRFEQVAPGVVRVHNHSLKLPPVGLIQVMKGPKLVNRIAPALHVVGTDVFHVKNVDVLHAGGMGLIAEFSSDLTVDNLKVIPPEGRMVSATSDATHFIGCRGKVTLKNCHFSNQLDDGTNVHGAFHPVADILGDRKIGIRMGHFQQQSLRVGFPGDTIGLVRPGTTLDPYARLTIRSVQEINSRYSILTVEEELPRELKYDDLVDNITAYPELLISNCEFSKNRARGALCHTSRPAVIENCLFHCDMEGIIVSAGFGGNWYESGTPGNIKIRGNTFQDCPYGGSAGACIRTNGPGDGPVLKNIEITDNAFNHFNNLVMSLSSLENCVVSGNTITNSGSYPMVDPERPAIQVSRSRGVTIENNRYSGKAREILQKGENCENVVFRQT